MPRPSPSWCFGSATCNGTCGRAAVCPRTRSCATTAPSARRTLFSDLSEPRRRGRRLSSSSAIRLSLEVRTSERASVTDYAEALWCAHRAMNESADFVMYWWHQRRRTPHPRTGAKLRRFGFVTTNSISQVFQRRVVAAPPRGRTSRSASCWRYRTIPGSRAQPRRRRCPHRDDGLRSRAPKTGAAAQRDARSRSGYGHACELACRTDMTGQDQCRLDGRSRSRGVQTRFRPTQGLSSRGMASCTALASSSPLKEAKYLGLGRREGLKQHVRALPQWS